MLRWIFLMLLSLAQPALAADDLLRAANDTASPINQRRAYGNACGPASLLNAFQYGDKKWQQAFHAVPGHNSRTRIRSVVVTWGNRPSKHIMGVNRWNSKQGINLLDLTDMANEMLGPHSLPKIKYEILTRKPGGNQNKLLQRSHDRISSSLKKGLPPILSIRRYAYRYSKEVGGKSWWPIRAHFIVVIEVPKKIPLNAISYPFKYVDPFGGFTRTGTINTDTASFTDSPFLSATMPGALIGKSFVKAGEETILTYSAIIGRW